MEDLLKKFGVRAGQLICLLDAGFESGRMLLELMPVSVNVDPTLREVKYDQIVFWPRQLEGLAGYFAEFQAHLKPDGAIWAVMPKKKYARPRGINFSWEQMQAAGLTTDLVDNKIATINELDYATKFVIRKRSKTASN